MGQKQGKVLLLGNGLLGAEYAIFSFWRKTNGAQNLCGKHTQCTYIYCPKKTKCVLRSITRSWLEKTVLLWNWNDLGSWSSGQRLLRCRIFFWEAKKPSWDRSEWSPVGVPQGKTHSGTFCYKLLSPMQYTIYSSSTLLIFFPHDWLIGRVLCTYICWGLECTILKTVHSLETAESCSWHIINSQFYILLALP